ncbi:hypothetical protein A2164_00145 [Candidatus Curtissbacteria bacterium RBG_13_35_7]|uniref:Erythromycin biosynthesis sensory transduction protein eryC1 n=1 Tax=Candidatus Curtissbacteria bacterium RBG_13_35_7 TaxID=1797705 RepID=A0A1F5G565_9BACT|nr:MAG: hypothetical protein A2164_00145 [Candidatus Curtissbacteria bacterium RBG_13_35_7]
MNIKLVNLSRQNHQLKLKLLNVIEKTINSANFIMGQKLLDFEKNFARYCDKKYAIGLNSGTDAIKLALMSYGVGRGDEVITVPNGYFSTAMVISELEARPVFVDVDPETLLMDVGSVGKVISKKTRAIIPVHLFGQPVDMDSILKLANKYNLIVIEDACQAHGALYKDKKIPFGETGAFSFYPGKNLGCFGDGGVLVTDNPEVYKKVLYLRNDGSIKKNIHRAFGLKSRLDTLQAAILNIKLPYLDNWNSRRREHAQKYTKLLSETKEIQLPKELPDRKHVYHLYVIQYQRREELKKYLQRMGIETGIHYPIPIHLQKAYDKENYQEGDFPVSEAKSKIILSLPMFPELTDEEILYITEKIKRFIATNH